MADLVIYVVERTDDKQYWQTQAAVAVAAPSEYHARLIAAEAHGDEDAVIWFQPTTHVTAKGTAFPDVEAGIFCRDYREV